MPDNSSQEGYGSRERSAFAEIFRTHLKKGTNPDDALNRPWTIAEFARKASVSASTISRWASGRVLPPYLGPVVTTLFGDNPALAKARDELIEAYREARDPLYKFHRRKYEDVDPENFQFYTTITPVKKHFILSLSLNVANIHNYMFPIDRVLDIEDSPYGFHRSNDVDDFLDYLIRDEDFLYEGEDDENYFQKIKQDIRNSINGDYPIIYRGSLQSATTKDIARLPALIKAMASLSGRQFRVGLFRLGTSIVVVSVISGGGIYLGWTMTKDLHELASYVASELTLSKSAEHK